MILRVVYFSPLSGASMADDYDGLTLEEFQEKKEWWEALPEAKRQTCLLYWKACYGGVPAFAAGPAPAPEAPSDGIPTATAPALSPPTAVQLETPDASSSPAPAGTRGAGRQPILLSLRGDPKWHAWVKRAAGHCRVPVSALIDVAVASYARRQGFEEAPPPRADRTNTAR
jgi:hypothetical protein